MGTRFGIDGRLTPKSLFQWQVLAHLATAYWIWKSPQLSDVCQVLGMYFLTGCLGMSVCYHRLLTHRSFETHPWIEKLFTLFATLGLTGSSISWTAAHRRHHARTDQPGDPHSPKIIGYWRAQWLSMFSTFNVAHSPALRSRFHRAMHRHYSWINLLYGIGLYAFGGLSAVLNWWLVPACLLWNAGSAINTICHTRWLGYKHPNPISRIDRSVNNPLLGLLMFGEGWHSNHHVYQKRANLGVRWWEIDVGFGVILLIRRRP